VSAAEADDAIDTGKEIVFEVTAEMTFGPCISTT
jgi:hypothetical protein